MSLFTLSSYRMKLEVNLHKTQHLFHSQVKPAMRKLKLKQNYLNKLVLTQVWHDL